MKNIILVIALGFVSAVCFVWNSAEAQSTQSLVDSNATFGSVWSVAIKTNSIQKDMGSLIGIGWNAVLNRTYGLGVEVAGNLGHNVTNYSYLQFLAQYIQESNMLLHYGGQIGLGFASVKDYQQPKTNMMDNFLNTSGTGYYFVEPQLFGELNVTQVTRVYLGLSYCFAFGLKEDSPYIAKSKVTNQDMSGVNVTIGVRFGKI